MADIIFLSDTITNKSKKQKQVIKYSQLTLLLIHMDKLLKFSFFLKDQTLAFTGSFLTFFAILTDISPVKNGQYLSYYCNIESKGIIQPKVCLFVCIVVLVLIYWNYSKKK